MSIYLKKQQEDSVSRQEDSGKVKIRVPFNVNEEGKEDLTKEEKFLKYWNLFEDYKSSKEQDIRFFNKNGVKRNILDYVKDSVDRMNEYHEKPEHKDDWQSNVFDPITRDKLIAILSKLAASRMKAEVLLKPNSIFVDDDTDMRRIVYADLLENANIHNQEQLQLVFEMYTAMSEGTVIGYESWLRGTRNGEFVKEINPDTGEKVTEKYKYDDWDDVYGEIVPIEEFYPENIWVNVRDFKIKVHRCFRRRVMTEAGFKDMFGKYKNFENVKTAGQYKTEGVIFEWGISSDVNDDQIEVLEYYDDVDDKMCVWANGTELSESCLPWNHKELPFWIAIFEPIHHQFLFGKSLPDKLMGMQDINNGLFNAMLDQLYIALNSPLFIAGEIDDLDDGYLDPKRVYTMTQGSTVSRGSIGGVDQGAYQMLSLIKRSMEMSSISDMAQGIPTGGRKTKFEVQQLQAASLDLAGMFIQLMESAMSWKYELRLSNILQYYSMPSSSKSGKKKFKYVELENRRLRNGKVGKKMIQIVGGKNEVPSKDELRMMAEKREGKKFNALESRVEPVVLTTDYLKNKDYLLGISIVPNSSVKLSESEKSNRDIAFYQATVNNPRIDQEENLKDFARAFGKDVSIVKEQEEEAPMNPAEAVTRATGIPGVNGMKGMAAMPAPAIDMEQL